LDHVPTVTASGSTLRLHYARWPEVQPHQHALVLAGSIVVQQALPADAVPVARAPVSVPPSELVRVVVKVRGLDQVTVQPGMAVQAGQLLALDATDEPQRQRVLAQLAALQLAPPPQEPDSSAPLQHVVGDPTTLLQQGIIDRREYQAILTRRQAQHQQAAQRQAQQQALQAQLQALDAQRRILAPITGTVQRLHLVEQQQGLLTVELLLARVPAAPVAPTASLAASPGAPHAP
jgi:multidrug efflux pump subunit AcrA (membrane-fusion protein)